MVVILSVLIHTSCTIQRSSVGATSTCFKNDEYILFIDSSNGYMIQHNSHYDHHNSRGIYSIDNDTIYFTKNNDTLFFSVYQIDNISDSIISIDIDTSLIPLIILRNNEKYIIKSCNSRFAFKKGDSVKIQKDGYKEMQFKIYGSNIKITKNLLLSATRGEFVRYKSFYGVFKQEGIELYIGDSMEFLRSRKY